MFDVPGQTPTPLADATYYDFRTTPISCKQPFLATGRGHYQLTELYGSRTVESANGHPVVPRFLFSTPPPTGARTRGSPRADQRDGCPDVRLYHFGEVCHAALSGSNVFACHMTSEAFKTPASCVQPHEGDVETSDAEKLERIDALDFDVGPRPGHDALRITSTPRIHTPVESTALAPVQWRNMDSFRTTDRYGSLSSLITYGNANEVPAERSLQQRHSTARPPLTLAFCCCFLLSTLPTAQERNQVGRTRREQLRRAPASPYCFGPWGLSRL